MRKSFAGNFKTAVAANFSAVGGESYSENGVNILFFGTIYNFNQLRDECCGDAKAVVRLYLSEGAVSFAKIDGSFTFILSHADKVMIVRDHHGTNSQVYYNEQCFASSLELLLQISDGRAEVNHNALTMFLEVGYIPTGMSGFKGVKKLDAGSMLLVERGVKSVINLFPVSIIIPATSTLKLEELSEIYGELHRSAIKRRIGDSRNVGILLSGGYDSGSNLAALRSIYDGDISSFTVGFKGDSWSEMPLAQCMSDTFGTNHTTYEIDGSEVLSLSDIVRELGDPFVEGGLMVNYAAMNMVSKNRPDIVLGGDGSDQYFGTSRREVAIHYLAAKYGVKPLLTMFHSILSRDYFDKDCKAYRMRFHLNKILHILKGDLFGFEPFKIKSLVNDRSCIVKPHEAKADLRSFEHLFTQHAYKTDIEKIINQVILFKSSRMADMFENNMGYPFLDRELYDFLKELPVRYKCKDVLPIDVAKGSGDAKFLLKYHYKSLLPEQITSKKKQGGFAPMPIFFKDNVRRRRIADFVMSSSVVGDFLNKEEVERFITQYDNECSHNTNWFWYKQNRAIQYFNLLSLTLWWEIFVKGNNSISLK